MSLDINGLERDSITVTAASNDFSEEFPFNQMKLKKLPDGNHAVYIPKLYWRSTNSYSDNAIGNNSDGTESVNKAWYTAFEISNLPIDGFELHPAFYKYPDSFTKLRNPEGINLSELKEVSGLWIGAYPLKSDYESTKLVSEPYKENDVPKNAYETCFSSEASAALIPEDWHLETLFERNLLDLLFLIDKGNSYKDIKGMDCVPAVFRASFEKNKWRGICNFYSKHGESVHTKWSAKNVSIYRSLIPDFTHTDGITTKNIREKKSGYSSPRFPPLCYDENVKSNVTAFPVFPYTNQFITSRYISETSVATGSLSSFCYAYSSIIEFPQVGGYVAPCNFYRTSSATTFRFVKYEV